MCVIWIGFPKASHICMCIRIQIFVAMDKFMCYACGYHEPNQP